jgi:hypothetical protein
MSKLFEEALADAKRLKEVAEENAKKAILESITPKIKSFIDQQIIEQTEPEIEEVEAEEEEEANEYANLDEDSITSLMEMLGVKKNIAESNIKSAVNKMSHQQRKNLSEAAKKANSDDKLTRNEINNQYRNLLEEISMNKERYYEVDLKALREAVEKEADDIAAKEELKHEMSDLYQDELEEESHEEGYGLDEEEIDKEAMDHLINEIKLALDLGEDIEEDMIPEELRGMIIDDEDESDEELDMEDSEEESEEEGEEGIEDMLPPLEGEEGEDAEPAPLEEVFEVDPNMLRQELRNIRNMLSEGKVDHHFGGKGESNAGHANAFGGKGAKKLGHQKSFGGGAPGKDVFVNPPASLKKLNENIRNLRRQNRAQQEKLNKYRGAVQTLREQLEDLNLFNAKLLYVNKLLQNNTLSESQKKSVIKALDEAKSLSETKSLYTSLTESLSVSASKKTLSESTRFGSSSRTTTSASTHSDKTVGESDRWAKLAGLK